MNSSILRFFVLITCVLSHACAATYKMCMPHHIFDSCEAVASKSNSNVKFECISGRDRMECLEKKEESEAEFRYEGIILTKKNNNINSMADLRSKKSCHTGFGRNVGYKIPITRLKKNGVLKVSADPALSSVEKELKALSEFFTASCIVGTYSPDEVVNRDLKQKYPNLCALCEDPVKCNYPDRYSGYDGSIRCLVENGGDVAFTKVIYVRQFFGLPIGNNPSATEAQANPDDYEYLCEDGSRRLVTGKACTWAKRPWQGFMSNADVNSNVAQLQNGLKDWYNSGLANVEKTIASDLWIDDKHTVVDLVPSCTCFV